MLYIIRHASQLQCARKAASLSMLGDEGGSIAFGPTMSRTDRDGQGTPSPVLCRAPGSLAAMTIACDGPKSRRKDGPNHLLDHAFQNAALEGSQVSVDLAKQRVVQCMATLKGGRRRHSCRAPPGCCSNGLRILVALADVVIPERRDRRTHVGTRMHDTWQRSDPRPEKQCS
jgi:hypothetical protein